MIKYALLINRPINNLNYYKYYVDTRKHTAGKNPDFNEFACLLVYYVLFVFFKPPNQWIMTCGFIFNINTGRAKESA